MVFLSTIWPLSAGLQFTSRMAPQPLGPQTQFFCKDDRNVDSGRSQGNPAFQMLPHSRSGPEALQGD